jgi:hypothetical protein
LPIFHFQRPAFALEIIQMEFDHAANDSPRSGSKKRVTPAVWATILVALVVIAIWFALRS